MSHLFRPLSKGSCYSFGSTEAGGLLDAGLGSESETSSSETGSSEASAGLGVDSTSGLITGESSVSPSPSGLGGGLASGLFVEEGVGTREGVTLGLELGLRLGVGEKVGSRVGVVSGCSSSRKDEDSIVGEGVAGSANVRSGSKNCSGTIRLDTWGAGRGRDRVGMGWSGVPWGTV